MNNNKQERKGRNDHKGSGARSSASKDGGSPSYQKREKEASAASTFKPKTELGRKVLSGEISDINQILDSGTIILESAIVDILVPNLQNDLILVGQSKGKFGGGSRRAFRQTQKKTKEGNKPSFSTYAIVGNGNGLVGYGFGKAKETVPAREKALRNAKLNLIKIKLGSGSWESTGKNENSIPFAVEGKCGSVIIKLMPAPVGRGLCCEKEIAKILKIAGIKDVWSKAFGRVKTKPNVIEATFSALKKLQSTNMNPELMGSLEK